MHSRKPIIPSTTGRNASKAMPIQFAHWQLIDWERATRIVKKLQRRIVKAVLMAASSNLRLSMLERYEVKVSRTVLRGGRGSNPPDLPDSKLRLKIHKMLIFKFLSQGHSSLTINH